ncbi:MAG: gliding motility lipoprotein GldH [Sphingobacteriales bacterium JAD_PAG50586_3]|nr:MAG: gliding motility lipoprotein GldH [Sphingobacteriales bacterium JAD_PAG50586_3]
MKRLIGVLAATALLLFAACDDSRLFDENKKIEGSKWNSNQPVEFEVEIADTNQAVNAYINLRNTADYQFSNIFLFLTTTFPNGKEAKDTLNCLLADKNGKWMGKGAGDLLDNRIMLKRNVYFNQKGKYKFRLEHAMRVDPLPNITDVGFRIEKSEGK